MGSARRSALTVTAAVAGVCLLVAGLGWWLSRPPAHAARDRGAVKAADGSDSIVPWVDRPAAAPTPTPVVRSPPPVRYPACTSAQLDAKTETGGAAAGNLEGRIRLTNTSTSPCTLTGYPTSFVGVRADGSQQTLRPHHGTFFDGDGYWPANLKQGEAASVTIGTADGCEALNQPTPHPDPFRGEIVGLPGGGTVTADAGFDPSCGLDIGELGVPAPPPADPNAYPGLTVSIDRPDNAPAGSTMHFTVTLTNPTSHAVDLDPCPVYTEAIYPLQGSPSSYSYLLNCDRVQSIAAGQAVTYAMQIPVPDGDGYAKFGWSIPTGSLFAGGVVSIAPAATLSPPA